MAIVTNHPLNYKWAENTSNKETFTETEFSQGIAYKGAVVSNRLNGVSNVLSQILQYNQATGGYYQRNFTYHIGNFVSIMHENYTFPQRIEQYICINDNDGNGIYNKPPIKDATILNLNGMEIYRGGIIDSIHWQRVDIEGSMQKDDITISNPSKLAESDNFTYCCKLIDWSNLSSTTYSNKVTELRAKCHIVTGNHKVTFRLECDLIDGTPSTDFFGDNAPDFYIDKVETIGNSNIDEQIIDYSGNTTPYGFNIVNGYITDALGVRSYGSFLVFGSNSPIYVSYESNIRLGFNLQVSDSQITVTNVIPVREGGGRNAVKELGQLNEYDHDYMGQYYKRGEVPINTGLSFSFTNKFSPFKMIAKLQKVTTPSIVDHTGCHTRAFGGNIWPETNKPYAGERAGELLEPGFPNTPMLLNALGASIWYYNSPPENVSTDFPRTYKDNVGIGSRATPFGKIASYYYSIGSFPYCYNLNPLVLLTKHIDNIQAQINSGDILNPAENYLNTIKMFKGYRFGEDTYLTEGNVNKYVTGYAYADITTRSISVVRTLKIF